jgi:hypothetical protein
VEESGRLLFIRISAYQAIRCGAPAEIEVEVDPVGESPARLSARRLIVT